MKKTYTAPLAAIALLLLAGSAQIVCADPTAAITVAAPPADLGPAFVPGVRLVEDLPRDYVEEEFFISGTATLYNYAHNPPQGPTDITAIEEDVPYKTRIIVRRPTRRPITGNRFNGTVVIEWWNSTAGFDTAPVWDPSADYFARNGMVYVGITNSTTSIDFLRDGCALFGFLAPACGTRYATLSLPENGLAFDIASQLASLLKSDDSGGLLPRRFKVEQVLHSGESQQGGSIITYASGFHLPDINDGYFVQSASNARRINYGATCGEADSPAFPDCTPRLDWPDNRVRSDLPVPVYQLVTQTDVEALFGTSGRQADTPTYRYYEVAGAAHLTVHDGVEVVPAGLLGPDPILLDDFCQFQINSTADGPVFAGYVLNALWQRMQEQVAEGTAPPAGALMDGDEVPLQRDEWDNVTGGVRLPSMEVPTGVYLSQNSGDPTLPPFLIPFAELACRLGGAVQPFDQATLQQLYPRHGNYVKKVARSVNRLKRQGLLLQHDAVTIRRAAADSDIGK